jgi:hypothetical protein
MNAKSQRRTVGAVLRVPLSPEQACFAVTLPEVDFAFFGPLAAEDAGSARLFEHPMLFRVAVHKAAWCTGRWSRIGKVAVPPEVLAPAPKFIQDPSNPRKFELYFDGQIKVATRTECEGLERAAVWDPDHVEQRLRDQLAGVPNVWVEQLRIK